MPWRPPRICGCGCGQIVQPGQICASSAARRAAYKAAADKRRPNARERGYTTAWDKARAEFKKAHPTCARCGAPTEVVDHITPHRGDKALMWDRKNWQPLCGPCHNRWKQATERGRGK
ncbi:HNH endonuclease [Xanthobacter sediminis]